MLDSLNTAISGLQQFQLQLGVIGNNIANANTTGYKSARMDFADTFSQSLGDYQVGSGVGTANISNRFDVGTPTQTGVVSDLYINGDGFFIVKDPSSNNVFATRAGDFRVDSQGYMITSNGYRLQGYSDAGLGARGDVQINTTGNPASTDANATVNKYSIGDDGRITVYSSDGSAGFVRGQVLLQKFTNPQALTKCGANLYSGIDQAGPLGGAGSAQSAAPKSSGLGSLQSTYLEMSNVDLTTEFSSLITTQRAFQANARMITTSDEVLQEIVNLKR